MKPKKVCQWWLLPLLMTIFGTWHLALLLHRSQGSCQPTGKTKRPVERRNISILLWHWPFNRSYPLGGDICLDQYGIPWCTLTDNRSHFDWADVVVFHHHELKCGQQRLPLHLRRPADQKWVWLSLEPPAVNGNLSRYNRVFNWTMTYRQDADIFIPYGRLIEKNASQSFAVQPTRPCFAAWVVSKYSPLHKRSLVYHQLKEHIPIEVYGLANGRPLSGTRLMPTIARCHFYLSFENSLAKDYVTEKLWRNAFQSGALPLVLGPPRSNYEEFVPPDSFIHVDDFSNIKKLAFFLNSLVKNRTQYESYFKWHQEYDVHLVTDWRERLCHICERFNKLPSSKIYHDLQGWFQQ